MKKSTVYLVSIIIFILFLFIDIPGLTKEAEVSLGIFLASLAMWIGVSIDWPSILSIFLIGFLPSFGFNKALQGAFGNSTVLFLLFTFMLVYPLAKTNFIKKVTLFFITNNIAKKGPWYFVSFLFISIFILGLFISPSVLFIAFMPFLIDILETLKIKKGSKFGNMLMMGSAFIISLSSGATPIGHVWPTLALSAYAGATGKTINIWSYMAFGIPIAIILLLILILIFRFIYKPELKNINIKEIKKLEQLYYKNKNFNKTSKKEKIILSVLIMTVLLWVVPSLIKNIFPNIYQYINSLTTAMPPMFGCIILFLLKDDDNRQILEFNDVLKNGIMWGAIFMTAAATLIGSLLTNENIGISIWISNIMKPLTINLPIYATVLFFTVWTIMETNFSSNIVTTTVVSSVAIAVLSANSNINLAGICSIIGFGAAICNMTPAGQSTINTVAISSGYTDTKSMFLWGLVFSIVSILVLSTGGYFILNILM